MNILLGSTVHQGSRAYGRILEYIHVEKYNTRNNEYSFIIVNNLFILVVDVLTSVR